MITYVTLQFSKEVPSSIERKKPTKSWWSPWTSWISSAESDSDEELVVKDMVPVKNLPEWLQLLKPEERNLLLENIGYGAAKESIEHPSEVRDGDFFENVCY